MNLGDSEDDDVQIVMVEPQLKSSKKDERPSYKRTKGFVKNNKSKNSLSWVSSSFGDFAQRNSSVKSTPLSKSSSWTTEQQKGKSVPSSLRNFHSESGPRKRQRETDSEFTKLSGPNAKTPQSSDVWSQKYAPQNKHDLAVHKKKVEEVENWLNTRGRHLVKHAAPILLLTGPPGAGKTACVRLLCAEHGFTVQEWVSATDQAADQWTTESDRYTERSKVDVYTSQSQSAQFHNFLLRANKYQALEILGEQSVSHSSSGSNPSSHHNVILVEDLPNVFFRDATQFHEILRKYHYIGHSPIIFVLTEASTNSSSTQKLFPKDLQGQLHVVQISVNPVAPTMLTKVLNRVVSQEARQTRLTPPSPAVIESIAMSCAGDIRAALNTLQFACGQDTSDISSLCVSSMAKSCLKTSRSKLKQSKLKRHNSGGDDSKDISSVIGAKDTSVFLFQAVGKILYFKRGVPSDKSSLPDHLKDFYRDPLLLSPEEVVSKSHVSSEFFTSFLHENYVEFMPETELDDLARAAEYFSDSNYIAGAVWSARDELEKYSVSVASRGYIHANTDVMYHDSKRKNMGWRPLHKSQWFNISKKAGENIVAARQLFKDHHWEPEVLCTEMLPYISVTNPTLHDTGQINFVHEMTQFLRHSQNFRSKLDEKDVIAQVDDNEIVERLEKPDTKKDVTTSDDDDDDSILPPSQGKMKPQDEEEDDFVIEDFDY